MYKIHEGQRYISYVLLEFYYIQLQSFTDRRAMLQGSSPTIVLHGTKLTAYHIIISMVHLQDSLHFGPLYFQRFNYDFWVFFYRKSHLCPVYTARPTAIPIWEASSLAQLTSLRLSSFTNTLSPLTPTAVTPHPLSSSSVSSCSCVRIPTPSSPKREAPPRDRLVRACSQYARHCTVKQWLNARGGGGDCNVHAVSCGALM